MGPVSIPKTIHYCWFGGKPLGAEELRCIESWKKYLPEYEIKRWMSRTLMCAAVIMSRKPIGLKNGPLLAITLVLRFCIVTVGFILIPTLIDTLYRRFNCKGPVYGF